MQRITQGQVSLQFQNDVQSIYAKMAKTQRQASTQQRINAAADDPYGTSQVIDFTAQLSDIAQYKSNVSMSLGMLDTEDTALDTAGNALKKIRDLVLQASNGTNDAASLASIAAEIRQLKESVRDGANAKFGSQYVFSGTATDVAPYPAPANAYAGNNITMNRRVSPGLQAQVNEAGPSVFGTTTGAAPSQMSTFDLIDQIVTDITTGTPASLQQLRTADLSAIDARFEQVLQARTSLGATAARLETTQQQLGMMEERVTAAKSTVADVDMTKTIMDFQSQQLMYQSALAAGTKIMQTSILNFL